MRLKENISLMEINEFVYVASSAGDDNLGTNTPQKKGHKKAKELKRLKRRNKKNPKICKETTLLSEREEKLSLNNTSGIEITCQK